MRRSAFLPGRDSEPVRNVSLLLALLFDSLRIQASPHAPAGLYWPSIAAQRVPPRVHRRHEPQLDASFDGRTHGLLLFGDAHIVDQDEELQTT